MSDYALATVCVNGHPLSGDDRISDNFCSVCGALTISDCPNCNRPIRGKVVKKGVLNLCEYIPPLYCYNCGDPFPWTLQAIQATSELIEEDERLDKLLKEKLTASLPDIVAETPKSSLATNRLKRAMVAAGKFTAEGLRQFVIDFGCEFVKTRLGF